MEATDGEEQDLLSDGKPRRGGHGREPNTTDEMFDPDQYRTPPGGETTLERNTKLQRIKRHWAGKWFRSENVRGKYQILFAFNPPWNKCIAEGCLHAKDE